MDANQNIQPHPEDIYKPLFQHPIPLENNSQRQETMNLQEAIYHIIVDKLFKANIGIGIIGSNYKVLDQNHLLKKRFDNIRGKFCYELYSGLTKPCNDCPMLAISSNTICSIDIKASEGRNYQAFCGSLPNPGGRADKIILIAEEITGLTKGTSETHSKMDILTIAAHELRQPLTVIKVYVNTLLNYFDKMSDDEKKSCFKDIDDSINHLQNLLKFFMETSRFEKGINLNKIPSQLSEILKNAVKEAALKKDDLNISLEIPRHLPEIEIDSYRIRQVIDNLIDNAIKYSPANTTVIIKASQIGNNLIVNITDNGIGIPFEETNKIFDKYYRIKPGSLKKLNGLGLGLYICRQFIEAHNGKIWVKSDVGKGSTFYFSLPVNKD